MVNNVFAIYDRKVQQFMPPFIMQTVEQARRAFGDTVNDPNHAFFRHPDDYELHIIASFDDSKAIFSQDDTIPTLIACGQELVMNPNREVQ